MLSKFRTVLWGKAPETKEEKVLLRKIDTFVLSFVCLMYCINYLDRANLANAYVSGMKEDVGLTGNTYTYAGSCFTAGYVIGNAMWGFVLSSGRVPPRVLFPGCMMAWGILTLGTGFISNYQSLYAIRLLAGIFEASTFSGTHYILGSWYKEEELGKRTAIFTASAQLGSLFSGVLAGAIISTLEGKTGLKGWQWLFVIDFIITFPVAIYGFFCFPDTPQTTKAFWMTEQERSLALTRLPVHQDHQIMTVVTLKAALKKAVTGWRYPLFCALFMVSATSFESFGIYTQWSLYMKAFSGKAGKPVWSTASVNYYPTILVAVAIVMTFVLTLWSDHLRGRSWNRLFLNYIMYAVVIISSSIALNMYTLPYQSVFFAYALGGIGYVGQASNFAWANELLKDDEILRALTLFSMNMFSNLWALWYQIVAYPVVTAPQYKYGQVAALVTGAASVGIATMIWYLNKRYPQAPPEHLQEQHDEYITEKHDDSSDGEKAPAAIVNVQPVAGLAGY